MRAITLGVLCIGLMATSCLFPPDPLERRREYIEEHPELDGFARQSILEGRLWAGMNQDEVVAVLGHPHTTERHPDQGREQWIYPGERRIRLTFLYFDDGILTHWNE